MYGSICVGLGIRAYIYIAHHATSCIEKKVPGKKVSKPIIGLQIFVGKSKFQAIKSFEVSDRNWEALKFGWAYKEKKNSVHGIYKYEVSSLLRNDTATFKSDLQIF